MVILIGQTCTIDEIPDALLRGSKVIRIESDDKDWYMYGRVVTEKLYDDMMQDYNKWRDWEFYVDAYEVKNKSEVCIPKGKYKVFFVNDVRE